MNTEISLNTSLRKKTWRDERELDIYRYTNESIIDALDSQIYRWSCQNPVFIIAPTGSGKNTFVENKIIPMATDNNLKLLIVSNRVALNRQEKTRIAQITGCDSYLKDYTEEGFDKIESFGNVDVITYQKLEKYLNSTNNNLRHYEFVILDECHFFYSDATFNANTALLLKQIPRYFKDSIRIYLTATPDDVMTYIIKSERGCPTSVFNYYSPVTVPYGMLTYIFTKSKSTEYKIRYFNDWDEIISKIKHDSTEDKWLIFVNSKKDGLELNEKLGCSSVFLSAESKSSPKHDGRVYSRLIQFENFEEKVLISTSVLNNGINIKDRKLKNIVTCTLDKTEFLQMVGRKRIEDKSEGLNLYYLAHSRQSISLANNLCTKTIVAIQTLKNNPQRAFTEYIHDSNPTSENFCSLLCFNGTQILLNEIGADRLYKQHALYESLLSQNSVSEACVRLMLSWLSLEDTYSEDNYLSASTKANHRKVLIDFLQRHQDNPIAQDKQEVFCSNFKELYELVFGKRDRNLDRADRNYGLTIIRKCLKEKEIPFSIESTGSPTEWIVRKE